MERFAPSRMRTVEDDAALARTAAERIVHRLAHAPRDRERLALCLTGGSTPEGLYKLLATDAYRARMPWKRIHWFFTDDRFVPYDDVRNNARMAIDALLDRVPVPRENVHRMRTDVASPHESARLYEAELRAFHGDGRVDKPPPIFDVVLMGLGPDGHTASLYPGQPSVDETKRWALGIDEAGYEPYVARVTLTLPVLASTREMLFLVSGADKRDAIARAMQNEDLPSVRAYSDGELLWLVTRSAQEARAH
jgi:6-phosphogluconolactonase